ncbi:hypothetical protein [Haloferula rosea]|uniref:Uncharacterized protein n=1 Tax=Haloferula rosea TaxID=490093 RepID=A0A934RAG1_9BACT|nr:hypothetical protein [Haloferula rosea]MBK1826915.1 hypothetical protein [Haloferula rosea]
MRSVLVLWLMAAIAHGAEVVGWRVPLDWLISPWAQEGATRDLTAPPEASAFFEKGDHLVDVKAALNKVLPYQNTSELDPFAPHPESKDRTFEGDWVVWNERSRMLVAKGDWENLGLIEGLVVSKRMPILIRCEVVFKSPSEDTGSSYQLLVRSGEKGLRVVETVSIEVEARSRREFDWVDLRLKFCHPMDERRVLKLEGGVLLASDEPTTLGFWEDESGKRWEIMATATPVTMDGYSLKDLLWMERDGKVEKLHPEGEMAEREAKEVELPDGLVLRRYHVAPGLLEALPFGRTEEEQWRPIKLLEVPDTLRGTGLGGVDAAGILSSNGVRFSHPLAMAGFFRSGSMLVMVNTRADHDLVEKILSSGLFSPPVHLWVELDWNGGGVGIRSRSGERSSLDVFDGEEHSSGIGILGTLGARSEIADVSYELVPAPGSSWKGATTVLAGHEVDLGSQHVDGVAMKVSLKASVLYGQQREKE